MFRTTKFALVLIALLAAIVAIPSEISARENSLKKDKWALQFRVANFVNLGSFQGSTLSIKKHTSDRAAWRLGFTLHFNTRNESTEVLIYSTNAPGHNDLTDITFRISAQKILYVNPQSDINFFWGFGPLYSYRYFLSDSDNKTSDGQFQQRFWREDHTWLLGLTGIIGVEWFATKSISFLAEYETSASYSERSQRVIRRRVTSGNVNYNLDTTNKLNEIKFSSSQVKLGLSVYF